MKRDKESQGLSRDKCDISRYGLRFVLSMNRTSLPLPLSLPLPHQPVLISSSFSSSSSTCGGSWSQCMTRESLRLPMNRTSLPLPLSLPQTRSISPSSSFSCSSSICRIRISRQRLDCGVFPAFEPPSRGETRRSESPLKLFSLASPPPQQPVRWRGSAEVGSA